MRIRSALREFTCGSLTISGGVAVFDSHHPIRLAANQTAELEEMSKSCKDAAGNVVKDAITLFAPEERYCFPWTVFCESVMGEKLGALDDFFTGDNDRGNSFLYRLTDLLRGAEMGEKINLARYAYTLARLEPKGREKKAAYQRFSQKMYQWAMTAGDRKELISAIYVHVYRNRKRKES